MREMIFYSIDEDLYYVHGDGGGYIELTIDEMYDVLQKLAECPKDQEFLLETGIILNQKEMRGLMVELFTILYDPRTVAQHAQHIRVYDRCNRVQREFREMLKDMENFDNM